MLGRSLQSLALWSLLAGLAVLVGCRRDAPNAQKGPQSEPADASTTRRPPPHTINTGHLGEYASMQRPQILTVRPDCLKKTGCPVAKAIPTCSAPSPGLTLEQVIADRTALVDRVITIRAQLGVAERVSSLVACKSGCCNIVGGEVGLTLGAYPDRFVLRFWNHLDRGRFACLGDESIVCCGVPIDGRMVRTTGVLRSIEHSDDPIGLPTGWYLDDAEVCVEP